MKVSILVFALSISLSLSSIYVPNPDPAEFTCLRAGYGKENDLCMKYHPGATRNRYEVRRCELSLLCISEGKQWDPEDYISFDIEADAKCVRYEHFNKLPGDICNNNYECGSKNCSVVCQEIHEGDECEYSEGCKVGLFCGYTSTNTATKTCQKLTEIGGQCYTDYYYNTDCVTNAYCYKGYCTELFSLPNGYDVPDYRLCQSGMVYVENKVKYCADIYVNQTTLNDGSSACNILIDRGSSYFNLTGTDIKYPTFSGLDNYACRKASNDPEYVNAKEKYKREINEGKDKRHGTKRFVLDAQVMKDFFRYHDYPYYEEIDDCVFNFFISTPLSEKPKFSCLGSGTSSKSENCVKYNKETNEYQVRKCKGDLICSAVFDPKDYSSFDNRQNAECLEPDHYKVVGDSCLFDSECASWKCSLGTCQEREYSKGCNSNSLACKIGNYCNHDNKCTSLKKIGETCEKSFGNLDCEIGSFCWIKGSNSQGTCTELFSLPAGTEDVSDYRLCQSGMVATFNNVNYCANINVTMTTIDGKESCLVNVDASTKTYQQTEEKLTTFSGTKNFGCRKGSNDPNYVSALEAYKTAVKGGSRHTSKRFKVDSNIMKEFFRYHDYPLYEELDDCVTQFMFLPKPIISELPKYTSIGSGRSSKNENCVTYDFGTNEYKVRRCEGDLKCNGVFNPEDYSSFDIKKNAECIEQEHYKKVGDSCNSEAECASRICTSGTCQEQEISENCYSNSKACDLGKYCSTSNRCFTLEKKGAICEKSLENSDCEIGLTCWIKGSDNQGICTEFFSLPAGTREVSDYRLCQSGMVVGSEDNKICADITVNNITQKDGKESCFIMSDLGSLGTVNLIEEKKTTFSGKKDYSCRKGSNDPDYVNALKEYKKALYTGSRHGTERFAVDSKIMRDFFRYHDYPLYEELDDAVFDFFMSSETGGGGGSGSGKAKVGLTLLLIIFSLIL